MQKIYKNRMETETLKGLYVLSFSLFYPYNYLSTIPQSHSGVGVNKSHYYTES